MMAVDGDRFQQLAVRLLLPLGAVTPVSIYFIGVTGVAPRAPFLVGGAIIVYVDLLLYEFVE